MKHEEPLWLKHWNGKDKANNCHLCWHYNNKGVCEIANEAPPKEYTDQKDNGCESWKDAIPF